MNNTIIRIVGYLLYVVLVRLGWLALLAYARSPRLTQQKQRTMTIVALCWGAVSALEWAFTNLIMPYARE